MNYQLLCTPRVSTYLKRDWMRHGRTCSSSSTSREIHRGRNLPVNLYFWSDNNISQRLIIF